jgi:hypothetical protein
MNDDPLRDDELAGMLRSFDHASAWSDADMEQLARRIDVAASPIFAQRTGTIQWWEFALVWSRPLLSFGATAAVIAALILAWAVSAPTPASARTTDTQSLLNSLVGPVEQQILNMSQK